MKVLNLQCPQHHAFEGWFASEQDFQQQLDEGYVECPWCEDTAIRKMPTAPRLSLSAASAPSAKQPQDVVNAAGDASMQAQYLHMMRQVLRQTEDVGERFADEARRMHHGETQERAIRGQASHEETLALRDEGISVLPLPIPAALKEPLQ